jgi:HSP20 family protein
MFSLIPWEKKSQGGQNGAALETVKHPLQRMERDFDLLFDRLTSDLNGWSTSNFFGRQHGWGLDVYDRSDEVIVRAEAPGFEPDEIDVQLSGNCLCISAERRKDEVGDDGSRHVYGSFRRMVTVPQGIEADKIEASYRNGVLEVHLPKGEEAKGKRIPIKPY